MIFKGQILTISLDTDVDITGFTGYIKYKKPGPNGEAGEWQGTISNDTVSYTLAPGDIDIAGVWKVQAYAVSGNTKKYGQIKAIEFRNPIQ